jgi:hypothetical protein
MRNGNDYESMQTSRQSGSRTSMIAGAAAGLALLATLAMINNRQKVRRFADRGADRRNPLNFFAAGVHPKRRAIDRNGDRPLFERRQSVYDSY